MSFDSQQEQMEQHELPLEILAGNTGILTEALADVDLPTSQRSAHMR
jgi:hypothetical protein